MNELDILWEQMKPQTWESTYHLFLSQVLALLGKKSWALSVTFCNDPYIRDLNREFRGKDESTDVLSFVQDESDRPDLVGFPDLILGDLVISLDTLAVNAAYFGVPVNEELKRISIHGLLHLQGWDHETNSSEEPMLIRQEEILSDFSGVKVL